MSLHWPQETRRVGVCRGEVVEYILAHLGTVTSKAIGELFGVGYTAVTEAVKRAASLLVHNKKPKERVSRILIDL
jgi:hypothetical protein